MTLGQIIKAYRETNSMSMDDFSKASKISKGYISQLENNLNPKTGEPPVPSILSTTYQICTTRNLMPYELMRSRSVSINGPVNQTLLSLISARFLTIYTSMP